MTHTNRIDLFKQILLLIDDTSLRGTCEGLLGDTLFWSWPAAVSMHHAYEGGLAEHTLDVALKACHIAQGQPHVNRDVLIAAALWHDYGKIFEYVIEDWSHSGASERPRHLTRNNDSDRLERMGPRL